jgi:hypothetical protein
VNVKVIETQVSFSSSILLKKNEIFQNRIAKLKIFYASIIVGTIGFTLFTGWLFLHAGFTLVSFLTYPVSTSNRNSMFIGRDNLFEAVEVALQLPLSAASLLATG